MQDRFKFRAVLKTDKFTILVETFYILNSCYFIDINKAEVEFKCKYPDECFWDFIEEIKKQDYIQEISIEGDLIITKDFTNLVQCTGLKDKHGKLIYDGDIVKIKVLEDFDAFGVNEKYIEINAPINYEYGGFFINSLENNIFLGQIPMSEIEVIGNIYENPELLSEVE